MGEKAGLWEDPEISHTTAPLSKMPTMYCVRLGFSATFNDVRSVADKTNAGDGEGEDKSYRCGP